MNIIEVFKSGKRFRRTSWEGNVWFKTSDIVPWSKSDILADDWEVEEIQVTITSKEFEAAWQRAMQKSNTLECLVKILEIRELVARELGL